MGKNVIKRTSQYIDNLSFDDTYEQAAVEILVENVAETALVRQKPIATEVKQDNQIALAGATTITEYNITCTNANTEYSQALPAGTKQLQFQCRGAYDIRYAYTTGKVATPTAPYFTLKTGMALHEDKLNLTGKTIFFSCGTAGQIIELLVIS